MLKSKPTQTQPKIHSKMAAQLQEARKAKRIRLDQAAYETKIKKHVLESFERGEVDLSNPYSKGLLIAYVKYLGLNTAQLEEPSSATSKKTRRNPPALKGQLKQQQRSKKMFVASTAVKVYLAVGFVLLSFSAVALLVYFFFAAPTLTVYDLPRELQTTESSLVIEGQAGSGSDVFINYTPVLVTPEGEFSQRIFLNPGVNIIRIEAENNLSRTAVVEKIIIANYERFD
ncbi:TPA: helix-turn-helix domain-containing protein [Candidatus Saccharibacteria bacterium]|nr:helix-turn-helix domain-containing protein [Candidatus Saccharibacteria bacterium]HIO87738.1 helix-turn-helix domain-containing protein [Candidatus Saccharibacteria bacterium]